MKQNIAKLLPPIIVLSFVIGVFGWYANNKKPRPQVKPEIVNPSDLESEITEITPTPTSFFFFNQAESEETQPTTIPQTSESSTSEVADSSEVESITTIAKTQVCTPVYGMADNCQEHIVVDTGAEENIAYSFSALSYLGGLIAFVKSKKN